MLLRVHSENPQPRVIEQAVRALAGGGIVVYPTDTAYGMGCDIGNSRAIDRLYQVKRRDKKKPLSVLCASLTDVASYAKVSNSAYRVLRRSLPGAYTFVLPAAPLVPRRLMPRRRTVGLRVPEHPVVRALVEGLGRPLVSSSACIEGEEPLLDAVDIEAQLGHAVDIVLDAGPLPAARLSSIVDLCGDLPQVLRQGAGDLSWIV